MTPTERNIRINAIKKATGAKNVDRWTDDDIRAVYIFIQVTSGHYFEPVEVIGT